MNKSIKQPWEEDFDAMTIIRHGTVEPIFRWDVIDTEVVPKVKAFIHKVEETASEESWAGAKLLFDRMDKWQEEYWKAHPKESKLTYQDGLKLIEWKLSQVDSEAYEKGFIAGGDASTTQGLEIKDCELKELVEDAKKEAREDIHEMVADERDNVLKRAGVDNFNKLDDEHNEGYWLAMNYIMKKLEEQR